MQFVRTTCSMLAYTKLIHLDPSKSTTNDAAVHS